METNKQSMYMHPEIAMKFAESEKKDEKCNGFISNTMDQIFSSFIEKHHALIANLGAGANPQKYPRILERVRGKKWALEWVDSSPVMLKLAQENAHNAGIPEIRYLENDFINYLESKRNDSLDGVMMQYCINYIKNMDEFFKLLSKKLKSEGCYVANLGSQVLTNSNEARFLVNGEEIGESYELAPGDVYTIQFLDENHEVYATTDKTFYVYEEIVTIAERYNMDTLIDKIGPHFFFYAMKK